MSGPVERDRLQLALLLAAGICLLTALWAGLYRAGWFLTPWRDHHPLAHGPLLLCGFLGVVISLEKARAVDRWWAYLAPLVAVVGGLELILRPDPFLASVAFAVASFSLLAVFGALLHRRPDVAKGVMLIGALAWLIGNLVWLGGHSIPTAVSWWLAFPVLTIVGERLELSRIVPKPAWALAGLISSLVVYAAGLLVIYWHLDTGVRLQGAGLILTAVWLLRFDLAPRTLRSPAVHRYAAICLLGGFVWLAVGGGLAVLWGKELQGLRYDALLHAILLGFVFGMIFGHVPIIAPMLLGRRLAFESLFYAPLALLQGSLILRLTSGVIGWPLGRSWGGLLNAVSLLLFLLITVRGVLRGERIG